MMDVVADVSRAAADRIGARGYRWSGHRGDGERQTTVTETPPVRLAYLMSQYPAINHGYLLREVRLLGALGMNVEVA